MVIDVTDDVMSAREARDEVSRSTSMTSSYPVRVELKAPRSVSWRHEGILS